jgi:mono/diheme cytochrome c family protein
MITRSEFGNLSQESCLRFSMALVLTLLITILACIAFSVAPLYAQEASQVFAQQCASCHGSSGKGDGPAGQYLNPKPTDFATSLKGKSDDWIAKAISGGGAAIGGSAVMPPFPNLSADQVKGLVDYIKHLGS